MTACKEVAVGTDDTPLDAWLRHALHRSFSATLMEPLPAELLALAGGQPPSCGLQMSVGSERRLSRAGEARDRA
jgi:hypothetical protein